MNKNLSSNSFVPRINGYLDAISDIDGGQREFFASFSMIQSENISVEAELKLASNFMEDIEIIKKKEYPDDYGIAYLLEKLLLTKPFTGLYEVSNNVNIPEEVIKAYRGYVIFHLQDYLDFSLEEEEQKLSLENGNSKLLLVKYKNNRNNLISYFITIYIEKKNIKQFLNFHQKDASEEHFFKYFNEIIEWKEKRTNN